MPTNIQILPDYLVDQIKAGEVIESPALLIKEILENSIDASSSEIELTLVNNGVDLIRIKDNGIGIPFAELPLAFHRHATSKITHFIDLYKIDSFGFRGEALASIASISKVNCQSSPINSKVCGGQITLEDGIIKTHIKNAKSDTGTIITISDLFYNTPVRLKFLKSKTSQKSEIVKIISSFIFSNPSIKFTIKFDNKDKKVYLPTNNTLSRINSLIKNIPNNSIINLAAKYQPFDVRVLLIDSHKAKNHRYIFINNRLIIDFSLLSIITKFYEENLKTKYNGGIFIDIKIPTSDLDINVHPNKTTVKYTNKNILFSLMKNLLKKEFENQIRENTEIKEYNIDSSYFESNEHFCEYIDQSFLIYKNNDFADYPTLLNLEKVFDELMLNLKKNIKNEEEIPLQIILPISKDLYKDQQKIISIFDQYKITTISVNEKLYINSIPNSLSYFNLVLFLPFFIKIINNEEVPKLNFSHIFERIFLISLIKNNFKKWSNNKNLVLLNNKNVSKLF